MRVVASMSLSRVKHHLHDPLFKNTYFLLLSSLTAAGSGFFFWLIAARFYSTEDVGLASAIIATGGLIGTLSLMGFDISLVRFLPEREDKIELINTCLTISFFVSLVLALVFIVGINIWSSSLVVIRENRILLLLFILFTATAPLSYLLQFGIFAGFRKTEYSFYQTLVTYIRVGIVPFLVVFGSLGVYIAYSLTPVLASVLGFFLILKFLPYKPVPTVKKEIISDIIHFSSGNYLARIFEELPTFLLPIMVINLLGAETNAYFFIAWQISVLLLAIPRFASISLLAEGSHNQEGLRRDVIRAGKFIFISLGLAITIIFLFGKYILWIFGEEYAKNSFELLLILAFGSILFAPNAIYVSVKRVQKEINPGIWVYGGIAVTTLVLGYPLMFEFGLIGAGYAWAIGNGVMVSIVGLDVVKSRRQKTF